MGKSTSAKKGKKREKEGGRQDSALVVVDVGREKAMSRSHERGGHEKDLGPREK